MKTKISVCFVLATLIVACSSTSDDSADAVIENKTVSGVSQKGPFVNGSSVTVQELDGKTLSQTGNSFEGKIKNDLGEFSVSVVRLASEYALLKANGFYRNEVTGEKSKSQITLYSLTNLSNRDEVNVNLLTHLEYERTFYLVNEDDMGVTEAKQQAKTEVLNAFGINGEFEAAEDLNIFGEGEGSAALLAISTMMQGYLSEADFSERLANFAQDIEEDGKWDDEQSKASIADWAFEADYAQIRSNIESWQFSNQIPNFEKYMNAFWAGVYGLGDCSEKNSMALKQSTNQLSSYVGEYFICVDSFWKLATAVERNTSTWASGKEGEAKPGDIDQSSCFVYENGEWREGDFNDCTLGLGGCINERQAEIDSISEDLWYICDNGSWRMALSAEVSNGYCDFSRVNEMSVNDDAICQCDGSTWNCHECSIYSINEAEYVDEKKYYCVDGKWEFCQPSSDGVCYINDQAYRDSDYGIAACGENNVNAVIQFWQDDDYKYAICAKQDGKWTWREMTSSERYLYDTFGAEWQQVIKEMSFCEGERSKRIRGIYGVEAYCNNGKWDFCNCNYDIPACYAAIESSGCDENFEGMVSTNSGKAFICHDSMWINKAEYDSAELVKKYGSCTQEKRGEVHEINGDSYVCDNDWRMAIAIELQEGVCTTAKEGSVVTVGSKYYACTNSSWKEATKEDYVGGLCDLNNEGKKIEMTSEYTHQYNGQKGWTCDYSKNRCVSYLMCREGSWVNISQMDYEDPCTEERNGEIKMGDKNGKYVCINGLWSDSAAVLKDYFFNLNLKYGELLDSRDGKTYKTIQIGQFNWMAENLNYMDSSNFNLNSSICTGACDIVGRVYSWTAAMDISSSCRTTKCVISEEQHRGVCPDGWHIPSGAEWERLYRDAGSAAAITSSFYSWGGTEGTNTSGFSVIPAGVCWEAGLCETLAATSQTMFWSATQVGSSEANTWYVGTGSGTFKSDLGPNSKGHRLYVRCIQDYSLDDLLGECNAAKEGSIVDGYACRNSEWREATAIELLNGLCTVAKEGERVAEESSYYLCTSGQWEEATIEEYTGGFCNLNNEGKVIEVKTSNSMSSSQGWHCEYYPERYCVKYSECRNGVWKLSTEDAYRIYEVEVLYGKCSSEIENKTVEHNDLFYGCQNAVWFKISKLEFQEGFCIASREGEYMVNGGNYYLCTGNQWTSVSPAEYQEGKCDAAKEGSVVIVGSKYYACTNSNWEEATEMDYQFGLCTEAKEGSVETLSGKKYVCSSNNWSSGKDVSKIYFLNSDLSYGTMTDLRDNHVYKTIKIGDAVWMAENLNYVNTNDPYLSDTRCNEDCEKMGRAYKWAAAMDTSENLCGKGRQCVGVAEPYKGVCPMGWHMPSSAEWSQLLVDAGDFSSLASFFGWNQQTTNASGFSVIPAVYTKGSYSYVGSYETLFWSSSQVDGDNAYAWYMGSSYSSNLRDFKAELQSTDESYYLYVRCVQNNE